MVFPQTPLVVRIEILVSGTWMDITADVYLRGRIQITWGRQDWASKANTTKCPLLLNNGRSRVNPAVVGRYSARNPRSDLYRRIGRNTRLRILVTTPAGVVSTRFDGFVSSWPTEWDVDAVSGAAQMDVWVSVQANGVRRRLESGSKSGPDAIRRHISRSGPLLYWPLTDGESARQGSEVVRGAQPMRSKGTAGSFFQGQPDWGRGVLSPWHDPVVQLPANTEGNLSVRIQPTTLTAWSADHCRSGIGGIDDDFTVFDTGAGSDANPITGWLIESDRVANNVSLFVLSSGETTSSVTSLLSVASPGIFDTEPHHIRLSAAANGSSTDWQLFIDGVSVGSGTHAIPLRAASRIRYRWGAFASLTEAMAIGHITYWGPTAPTAAQTWQAVQGHARELAGRRIERLCAEQGVPLAVAGNLDRTPPMGPQKGDTFLALVESAAEVDGGTIYESRDTAGFAYRTRASKYNQGM
jgi:hypothetical protein